MRPRQKKPCSFDSSIRNETLRDYAAGESHPGRPNMNTNTAARIPAGPQGTHNRPHYPRRGICQMGGGKVPFATGEETMNKEAEGGNSDPRDPSRRELLKQVGLLGAVGAVPATALVGGETAAQTRTVAQMPQREALETLTASE